MKDSAYLFLGSIGSAFENTMLGIKDKLAVRAIAGAYVVPEEEVKKRYARTGDLGDVAFELSKKMEASLTIEDVFQRLVQIKEASGKGSQEEKTGLKTECKESAERDKEKKY